MDAVTDPTVAAVVVMASAQCGKTEVVNNTVGYHVDQDPAPILLLQPTLDMAEAYSKDRLAPMLRDTPCLRGKVKDARSRDSGNTLLHKIFPGGHITMAGANSPASLASRPIRITIFDEVDRYPFSAGTEGDPVDLGRKRSTTFWNRKSLETSTPGIEGVSRIATSYLASDQRRYYVPCCACRAFQVLVWSQVKWDGSDVSTAHYECIECGAHWNDSQRDRAVRLGEWRATAEFKGVAGFHIWEAYSPWVTFSNLVAGFLKANGSPERLKTWVNTSLGETWKEQGEAPEWQRLYERARSSYPIRMVPGGGLFLTAGADVQKDRIEIYIYAWGRGKTSWLVDQVVLSGDTSRQEVWEKLTGFLGQTYQHECGVDMPIVRLAIDSGYATQEVYAWARRHGPGRVLVIKGVDQGAAIVGVPSAVDVNYAGQRIKRGIKVWPVNVSALKSELYGWLGLQKPTDEELLAGVQFPPGYCHFPELDEEFFRQITAEQIVTRVVKGYQKREWEKTRDRNEALDCRNYARAAASQYGMDRFNEHHWIHHESQMVPRDQVAPVPAVYSVPLSQQLSQVRRRPQIRLGGF